MDYKDKKITIITPCHNSAKYILDCWKSIKQQTIGIDNLVCIFVDDASTDNTWEMLLQIESEEPDSIIVLHLDENVRQGGARNIALAYVNTPYVQFLDSDDCLGYNACEILYDYANKYDADLIQFGQQHFRDNLKPSMISKEESEIICFNIKNTAERKLFLDSGIISYCHSNKFYKTSILNKSGVMFAENKIFEEPPFVYPLMFYTENIIIAKEPFYICRLHADSTMSKDKAEHFYDLPNVQYELLQFMLRKEDIYPIFREEINSYFYWSYYILTILSAYQNQGILNLEYFRFMQQLCRLIEPGWALNPHNLSYGKNAIDVLSSINHDFLNQKELNEYIASTPVALLYEEVEKKKRIIPNLLKRELYKLQDTLEEHKGMDVPVSIILTTYNRAEIVSEAIKSILRQDYDAFELIVVDDCSSDFTEDIIRSFSDSRIKYIRNSRNLGAGGSRNVGIMAAKYDYIAFEDDDDIWHPDKLKKQMQLFSLCDERVGLIYCEYAKRDERQNDYRIIPDRNLRSEFKSGYIFPFMLNRNAIGADTVVVRKSVFDKIGMFNEELPCLEDWELFLRISKEYYVILYPEVLLDVNVTPGSVSFKKQELQLNIINTVQSNYIDDLKRLNIARF